MYNLGKNHKGDLTISNGDGRRATRPIMVDDVFFTGSREAQAHFKCTYPAIATAIASGHKYRGREVRYATKAEVKAGLEERNGVVTHKIDKAAVKAIEDKDNVTPEFVGVVWPDGSVEVRSIKGRLRIERTSMDTVPHEVQELTAWMSQ